MDEVICDKCGREMNYKIESSTQGWFCDYCGWNIVTSFIKPIDEDTETYCIFICNDNEKSIRKIKCIAQISGENYVKAKELLNSDGSLLCKGDAKSVKQTIQMLVQNKIRFTVEPEFPYNID